MQNSRISTLDGFRALAIFMVILFHYFSRWTMPTHDINFYPYGGEFSEFPVFKYGYLGVQLFFVISGFVISMTLEKSTNWRDFAVKRFARLWPAIFLCSLITYWALSIIPLKLFPLEISAFIPSLIFIDPDLIKNITGIQGLGWIDGAYWSLAVEVKFYLWAAVIFFFSRGNFLRNFLIFFNMTLIIRGISGVLIGSSGKFLITVLFFPKFLPWFLAGIGFYYLFTGENKKLAYFTIFESFVVILLSAHTKGIPEIPFYIGIFALFFTFIYKPEWLKFFSLRPISAIGAASYSLYLLHQNMGVTLIYYIDSIMEQNSLFEQVMISVFVMVGMTVAALLIYRLWEIPSKNLILWLSSSRRPKIYAETVATYT